VPGGTAPSRNLDVLLCSEGAEETNCRPHFPVPASFEPAKLLAVCFGLIAPLLLASACLQPQKADATSLKKADDAYETGMHLLHEGHYAAALAEFRLLEKDAPDRPQGATGEGIALALEGHLAEAEKALTRALQIDPSDWMPRRERGIVEWQLNRKDQAAKDLLEIVKLFPNDEAANSLLGQCELAKRNYSQAATYFAAAPTVVARNPGLKIMAAEALLKGGRLNEAKAELAGLINQSKLTQNEKFRLGWLLGQAQEYPEAIQVFNSLRHDYPNEFKVNYGIALAYFEEGKYSQCIFTLRRYTAPGVTRATVLSLLGVAEVKNGQTQDAFHTFLEGIRLFPSDDECYLDVATLSAVHLNYDLPLRIIAEGIERIPRDYKLFLTRGLLRNLEDQDAMALADYRKALGLAPNQASIYVAMGLCYEDEDKYAEAVAILEKAVKRHVKDVLVYYFLADALFREGITPNSPRFEEAQSAVDSGLNLDSGYPYTYMQKAKLEMMTGGTQAAIVDLERAHKLEPSAPSILYQLALAYRQAGRTAESKRILASAVAANKNELKAEKVRVLEGIMAGVSSRKHSEP
jgi:tetratricopeptide (TPR) repeat protein